MIFNQLFRVPAALLVAPMLWVNAATAQEQGTPEEAQAMAEAAAALFHADGAEASFDAYTNAPEFHDRDLYVFVLDGNGMVAAHGANQAFVGRDVSDLRDPTGTLFNQAILAIEDTGWVDYQWQNPVSGNVEPKTSYIVNVGEYWIGVGAYVN